MHAYENALSELLTKPDVVKSDSSKAVRDARKELVVQIERVLVELEKKVMKALGVGEEEGKVETAVGMCVWKIVLLSQKRRRFPRLLHWKTWEVHKTSQPQAE